MPLYSPETMSNIAVLLGPFEFPLLVLRTKRKKIIWVQAEGLWEAVTVANCVYWLCECSSSWPHWQTGYLHLLMGQTLNWVCTMFLFLPVLGCGLSNGIQTLLFAIPSWSVLLPRSITIEQYRDMCISYFFSLKSIL